MTPLTSFSLRFLSSPSWTASVAEWIVLPKTKAFGVLSGTIAIFGGGMLLLSASSFTVVSSHGFCPGFMYCSRVDIFTTAGPIRYWNSMKIVGRARMRIIQLSRLIGVMNCWTMRRIMKRKVAKINDTIRMLVVIASFSCPSLGKVFPLFL